MATVGDLVGAVESIAPFELAEEWDNVGLIAGDEAWDVRGPVLLTIDLTWDVVREAIAMGVGAVVAYHPPIFSAIKRIEPGPVLDLIAARIAIVSPHTALDAAPGGMADFLADIVATPDGKPDGGVGRRAITPHRSYRSGNSHKVVTFVPKASADAVRDAMADAGAGMIGEYTSCSFAAEGRGSFLGSDASNPSVGARGKLEHIDEVRLEMVCPSFTLARVIDALRSTHPYEEPPIDVHSLTPVPNGAIGAGRAVTLEKPISIGDLASRVKQALGVPAVQVAQASASPITRVGVCPGSGGSLVDAAREDGCFAFVTGEMKHHDVLHALSRGVSVILAGHTETERPYLPRLAERIREVAPVFAVKVSKADRSPFAM